MKGQQAWTQLLLLSPLLTGKPESWKLSPSFFAPQFAPEAQGAQDTNKVLIYVPPEWTLTGNVRKPRNICVDHAQANLLLFEATRATNPGSGFGRPSLKLQLPATVLRFVLISSSFSTSVPKQLPSFLSGSSGLDSWKLLFNQFLCISLISYLR